MDILSGSTIECSIDTCYKYLEKLEYDQKNINRISSDFKDDKLYVKKGIFLFAHQK